MSLYGSIYRLMTVDSLDKSKLDELADRLDGKPAQAQVHSDAGGKPLQVIIRRVADVIGAAPPTLIDHDDGGDET